jgi:hypothetical protein
MRKNILVVILGLAMLLLAGIAGAEPMKLTDNTKFTDDGTVDGYGVKSLDYNSHGWGDVNRLDGSSDYVSWTHHYGFTPPAGEVIDGSLTLWLRDDSGRDPFEFAFGWAEDGTLGFGEVDTIDYTYDINASYLKDGSFSVVLASLWNDFYIDQSVLDVTYNPSTPGATSAPVPEPATMLLLGSGLIGISSVGRKKFFKR